eukprot:6189122-Pleurochrysis_carterae.AAC.2
MKRFVSSMRPSPLPHLLAHTLATLCAARPIRSSVHGRWYEAPEDVDWKRGAIKWTTLEHGGVIFPPPYAPHGIKVSCSKCFEMENNRVELMRLLARGEGN